MNIDTTALVRSTRLAGLAGVAALSLGACSIGDTFDGVAVELIENDLAESLAIELTDAECADPGDGEVGSTFDCTASAPGGETARFTGTIEADDFVRVVPTNVFGPEDFELVEGDAPGVVELELQVEIDSVECPDEGVVLVDNATTCTITAADGSAAELIVTFDAAAQQLLYDIGAEL